MRDYTLYSVTTGEIVQSGYGLPPDRPGTAWIAGQFSDATHYIDAAGAPQELPPRPSRWHTFDRDSAAWQDRRSNADMAAKLAQARAAASRSKPEFLAAAMMSGFIDPAEAKAAANGDIPAPFLPAVAQMPAYERAMLEIVWPSCTRIERMEPFIVAIAQASGITEDTLDALFGVVVDD